ncbi:MAG TPA: FHA domain-containing protein [Gemmatimonadaceae bacterium]|nr:FHA domain-containing protein [Gemmatimonadaceae bacterium]
MILEVVHPTGTRTWHRLGDAPVTLGRGFANDLILDDPYVDARHARIALDETGAPQIEDLGSVNGLIANHTRLSGRVALRPGAEIRIGRTMLRIRDSDEPVSPALVDAIPAPARAAPVVPPAIQLRRRARVRATIARSARTTWARLLTVGAAAFAIALYSWAGSSERASANEALFAALGFVAIVAVWAGIWAVASRVSVQRFHFVAHMAVAAVVTLGGMAWTVAVEWLSFFFPDASLADVLSVGIGLFTLAALVAGHLSFATGFARGRRWKTGFVVAGVALSIGGLAALTEGDTFSDVPAFSGVVKPVGSEWLPTTSVEEFGSVMETLKQQVDEMAGP